MQELIEELRERLETIVDDREDRFGGNRKAAIAGTVAVPCAVILLFAVVLGAIPLAAGPGAPTTAQVEAPPVEDLGSGRTSEDIAAESEEENVADSVPDEAKTVRELSQERVVEAEPIAFTDATHLTVRLVNGDEVTVRLLNVTEAEGGSPYTSPESGLPYDFKPTGTEVARVWLERDDITQEEDGTWPRYVWTADPREATTTTRSLYQAWYAQPNATGVPQYYEYAPEDGADRYTTVFNDLCVAPLKAAEAAENAEADEEARAEELRKLKEERERAEAEALGEGATSDEDDAPASDDADDTADEDTTGTNQ